MSDTMENVIVILVMIAIAVGLLCFVGFDAIEKWCSEPFVWEELEGLSVELVAIKPGRYNDEEERLFVFAVENDSREKIKYATFQVELEGIPFTLDLSGSNEVDAHSTGTIEKTFTYGRARSHEAVELDEKTFQRLISANPRSLDVKVHTKSITNGDYDEIINNNGIWKCIIIVAISLALALLGFSEKLPQWLRIVLKVCGLPAIGALIALLYFAALLPKKKKKKRRESYT